MSLTCHRGECVTGVLIATGALRPGLPIAQTRDILLAISGHLPEPLLDRAGWAELDYVDLMSRLLQAALLAPAA